MPTTSSLTSQAFLRSSTVAVPRNVTSGRLQDKCSLGCLISLLLTMTGCSSSGGLPDYLQYLLPIRITYYSYLPTTTSATTSTCGSPHRQAAPQRYLFFCRSRMRSNAKTCRQGACLSYSSSDRSATVVVLL